MKLTKEQFQQLNAFCGYGDYKNVEVIYFGIEEGLGGWPIEPNILARCDYYGKDPLGWFQPNKREAGYFERSGDEAADKMKKCLKDLGIASKEEKMGTIIQSLEFMSRLSLFLEEPEKLWFELKGDQPELYERITQYWRESRLFHAEEKIKTALFDWKPLPRANVSDWPYTIEDQLFSQKEYDRAYEFKKVDHPFLNEMVQQRLNVLENILSSDRFSILISFGDRPGKVKLLSEALTRITGQSVQFQEEQLQESRKKISVVKLSIQNKERFIVCTPFFDSRSFKRKGLEELAHYLLPHFKKRGVIS